jgi:hypothetical protein
LDLGIGEIRKGNNRCFYETPNAGNRHKSSHEENEKFILERKGNNILNYLVHVGLLIGTF